MKPLVYFDAEVRGGAKDEGLAMPVMERLMAILHGVFRQQPGKFAIALPGARTGRGRHPGNVIRVFAETRDDLDLLVTSIHDHHVIRDYVTLGDPRKVPPDFSGPWREYRRYRITNRGSRLDKCREYRLQQASELPYFRSLSKSTGHGFGVYVAPMEGEPADDCQPDSYGLSVSTRPFALPMLT